MNYTTNFLKELSPAELQLIEQFLKYLLLDIQDLQSVPIPECESYDKIFNDRHIIGTMIGEKNHGMELKTAKLLYGNEKILTYTKEQGEFIPLEDAIRMHLEPLPEGSELHVFTDRVRLYNSSYFSQRFFYILKNVPPDYQMKRMDWLIDYDFDRYDDARILGSVYQNKIYTGGIQITDDDLYRLTNTLLDMKSITSFVFSFNNKLDSVTSEMLNSMGRFAECKAGGLYAKWKDNGLPSEQVDQFTQLFQAAQWNNIQL